MNKNICQQIQYSIQELHDLGKSYTPKVLSHLKDCKECTSFKVAIETLEQGLTEYAQADTASQFQYDVNLIAKEANKREQRKSKIFAITGMAAALIIGVSTLLTTFIAEENSRQAVIVAETHTFVDTLFEEPLLEDLEYSLSSE
jgi:hypothetical protein